MYLRDLLFNFNGRISRAQWWLATIVLLVVTQVLLNIVQGFSVAAFSLDPPHGQPTIATSIAAMLAVIPQAAITAKRFNDRGYGPWVTELYILVNLTAILLHALNVLPNPFETLENEAAAQALTQSNEFYILMVLSTFSLWVLIENGFRKGTDGPNQYGPDPLNE